MDWLTWFAVGWIETRLKGKKNIGRFAARSKGKEKGKAGPKKQSLTGTQQK